MVDHDTDVIPTDPPPSGMAARRRLLAACALVATLVVTFAATATATADRARAARGPSTTAPANRATVIDFVQIEGVIDPPTASYLLRRLDNAPRDGAGLVVVQLDTPGGLNAPLQKIVERILASKVPVVAWVSPSGARAASAGAFVTLAANVAAMAPGTTLGPAHPANLAADERRSNVAGDASALLRSIGEARGRDVHRADRVTREAGGMPADEAVAERLADFVAGSPATLFRELDGRTVEVGGRPVTLSTANYQLRFHKTNVMERLLHTALRPEIAYFLLLFGLFGLIFEIYNPGVGAAGLTGGICLAFSFYALSILPTSWIGVALLVLAVALFLVEMHGAGLGVFTVAGLAAFIGGSVMLFSRVDPALRIPWTAIAVAVACMLLFFISVMTAAIRSRSSVPTAGSERMAGMIGEARTDIAPEGQVFAKGSLWKARTAGMAIPEGAKVTILGVSGLMLIVEQVEAVATPE
jgi:membrane-bound serine protease (ClpP class)